MIKKSIDDLVDSRLSALKIDKEKMQNAIFGTTQKRKGYKQWKLIAAAACLVVVLSLTALAAGFGYFDLFFETKTEFIGDKIVGVNQSVEKNGIIYTVESAYTTESGGYISVSFQKKDGSTFGHEPHDGSPIFIYDFKAYSNVMFSGKTYPLAQPAILSEDSKTLYALLYINRLVGKDSFEGKKVNARVDFVQGPRTGARYEGPWEIEVKMPKVDESKRYEINFTATVDWYEKEVTKKTVTINSISLSPTGFIIEGIGDAEVIRVLACGMSIKFTDGSEVIRYVSRSSSGIVDGKTICNGLFTKPINDKEIEYIDMYGEKITLN